MHWRTRATQRELQRRIPGRKWAGEDEQMKGAGSRGGAIMGLERIEECEKGKDRHQGLVPCEI